MEFFQIALLALIQGITEFLPISSSAHLILPSEVLGWPDQGLAFDVAVHVGSLAAVLLYFRDDIVRLITQWCKSLVERKQNEDSRLAWFVILATIPAGLAGLLFNDFIEQHLRSMFVIMIATVFFGLYLGACDHWGKRQLELSQMTLLIAIVIGCCQALALIPGTSRSGITMSAALMMGLRREPAARFSFLLSIPIITLTGLYEGYSLVGNPPATNTLWRDLFIGASLAGVSAFLCIHFFLQFIKRIGMLPFVIYRLILGGVLGAIILMA